MLRKLISALIIGFLVHNTAVMAQGVYPERPIKLVIGYPPGGAADFVARISADQISKEIGVPVNVENRPGVGGAIAADLVAKAAPDGYTTSFPWATLLVAQWLFALTPMNLIKIYKT